jgi:hypothetical protein
MMMMMSTITMVIASDDDDERVGKAISFAGRHPQNLALVVDVQVNQRCECYHSAKVIQTCSSSV